MNSEEQTKWFKARLRESLDIIEQQMREREARALAKGFRPVKLPEDENDAREIWEIKQLLQKDQLTRKDIEEMYQRVDEYTKLIAPWGLDEWHDNRE